MHLFFFCSVLFCFRHIFVSATNFPRLPDKEASNYVLLRLKGHTGRTSYIERKQVELEFSEETL